MSSISASLVKELRDRTGLGMMDCKNALVGSAGDIEQAIESLRKSSGLKAAKKAGRVASEGLISVKLSDDQKSAVLVEVNCETDFAARDENFKSFVDQVTAGVFESKETDVDAGCVASLILGILGIIVTLIGSRMQRVGWRSERSRNEPRPLVNFSIGTININMKDGPN